MCFKKQPDKWRDFTPTAEYLAVVKDLTSITKLWKYTTDKYDYISDEVDYWKTPLEFMSDEGGRDCEDWSRWYVDILVRIQKLEGARWVLFSGYNNARWGKELNSHAMCIFPYKGKFAVLDVEQFQDGYENYIEAGHRTFPNGITYVEERNYLGEILSKKRKWIGTF